MNAVGIRVKEFPGDRVGAGRKRDLHKDACDRGLRRYDTAAWVRDSHRSGAGVGAGRQRCGSENGIAGPPTTKKPETNAVGPGVTRGSLIAGGWAAMPKQSG